MKNFYPWVLLIVACVFTFGSSPKDITAHLPFNTDYCPEKTVSLIAGSTALPVQQSIETNSFYHSECNAALFPVSHVKSVL